MLWPARLYAALRQIIKNFRLLCCVEDSEWDAVEGALRGKFAPVSLVTRIQNAARGRTSNDAAANQSNHSKKATFSPPELPAAVVVHPDLCV